MKSTTRNPLNATIGNGDPSTFVSDADIDKNIDPGLSTHDRQIVRSAMLEQPPFARKNLVFLDAGGRIYSNRSALLKTTSIRRRVAGKNAVYDEAGRVVPLPPRQTKPGLADHGVRPSGMRAPLYGDPPETTLTGPYRRLWSDPGYTYAFAQVSLPCNATAVQYQPVNYVGPAGDAGQIYSGGWSNSGGDQADAGLVYSASRNQYDEYLVVSSNSAGQIFNHTLSPSCGQTAFLTFYITPSLINLNISLNGQNAYPLTLSEPANNQNDWYGPGDVLKYMVSIAQNPDPSIGYAQDGYDFAMSGGSPQVQINNPSLGQCTNGTNPPYSGASFPGADYSYTQTMYAQIGANNCGGLGTQNWQAASVPDDGEVVTQYGNYTYPVYNYETEGIAMYDSGGDPPANGSSIRQTVTEKCPTDNDPPAPKWYYNHFSSPDTTTYYTAQGTTPPTSKPADITINLTNSGPQAVNVALIDPSGTTVATTQIAANTSGGIDYYAAGAAGGSYHFNVSGAYGGSGTDDGCLQTSNVTSTDAQWTGNFNWH
ncbi:MAG TPA: hypothetical protein VK665_01485 [Candidatus Elarobacter sp.]|nr:hypothetical protein [Candidatus Elarobacter sp.]